MMISLIQMKPIILFGQLTEDYHHPYLQLEKDIVLPLLRTYFIMVAESLLEEDLTVKLIG